MFITQSSPRKWTLANSKYPSIFEGYLPIRKGGGYISEYACPAPWSQLELAFDITRATRSTRAKISGPIEARFWKPKDNEVNSEQDSNPLPAEGMDPRLARTVREKQSLQGRRIGCRLCSGAVSTV